MKSFSYTKSTTLIQSLTSIDTLRREMLLLPLSPQTEIHLQYNAKVRRIQSLLSLHNEIVSNDIIQHALTPLGKHTKSPFDGTIDLAKRALDHLYYNWLVNEKSLEVGDIQELYYKLFQNVLTCDTEELRTTLDYVQINPEHPVIQASLIHILTSELFTNVPGSTLFVPILGNLVMYKFGYDFRRCTGLENGYAAHITEYQANVALARNEQNLTYWLEFTARTLIAELESTLDTMKKAKNASRSEHTPTEMLSERQQSIVELFNKPGVRVNNRQIQRLFKISQITASRDLSLLSELGIIIPVGKGRSTSYVKV